MEILFLWAIICFVWRIGLYIVQRFDHPAWKISLKEYRFFLYVSGINAMILFWGMPMGWTLVVMAVFAGCLILGCITDCKACEVYQFIWWVAGAMSMLLLCKYLGEENVSQLPRLVVLLFYCILQECFFCKFYGRADCHAFVICALAAFGMGMDLLDCLVHMLLAFVGLAVVQLFRGNVNRKGNLKHPVAFLPYITIFFWLKLCCFCLEKVVY